MDDRLHAKAIEFQLDETGKVWVNIDGKCVLRIGAVDQCVIAWPHGGIIENFKGPESAISPAPASE